MPSRRYVALRKREICNSNFWFSSLEGPERICIWLAGRFTKFHPTSATKRVVDIILDVFWIFFIFYFSIVINFVREISSWHLAKLSKFKLNCSFSIEFYCPGYQTIALDIFCKKSFKYNSIRRNIRSEIHKKRTQQQMALMIERSFSWLCDRTLRPIISDSKVKT